MTEKDSDSRELQRRFEMTEKMASAGILAAGIAHEVNNPLTVVLGLSKLLADDKRLPADAREMCERIAANAERAGKITRSLLDFARESKPMKRTLLVADLFERIEVLIGYELKSHLVNYTFEKPNDDCVINADLEQMGQVLLNLLINAEHAMTDSPEKKVRIGAERSGNRVIISIADTGPGIPADKIEKIFEPFYTTKPVGKGTGLGLSICYTIVEDHGGMISIKSPVEGGALFRIELPAA